MAFQGAANRSKQDIASAALGIAERVHDGRYAAVIVSGGSNEISRGLLAMAWTKKYPGEPLPKIFAIGGEGNAKLWKDDEKSNKLAATWLEKNMPDLLALRDKKLCFLDEYMISGYKMEKVNSVLKELGFNQVDRMVFVAPENEEMVLPEGVDFGLRQDDALRDLRDMTYHIKGEMTESEKLRRESHSAEAERLSALEELREMRRGLGGR